MSANVPTTKSLALMLTVRAVKVLSSCQPATVKRQVPAPVVGSPLYTCSAVAARTHPAAARGRIRLRGRYDQ